MLADRTFSHFSFFLLFHRLFSCTVRTDSVRLNSSRSFGLFMLVRVFPIWVRLFAMAFVAFIASGLAAPSTAKASCGDYVTVGGQQNGHGTTDMVPPGTSKPCQQCPQKPSQPGKAPCRGPECSGGETPLPVPPSTGLERVPENWAYFWMTLLVPEKGAQFLGFGIEAVAPLQHSLAIFHPPRA